MLNKRRKINIIQNVDFDACNMNSEFVKKIEGLPSDSASFTDIWFLHFKNHVYYNFTKPITSGVYKIFINPDSLNDIYKDLEDLQALNYEFSIYKDKILPLIENNICPSFITCLSSGQNCSYGNLFAMLNKKLKGLTSKQIDENLKRNIYYMLSKTPNRHSINDILKTSMIDQKTQHNIVYNLRYNIIFTKSINKNTMKLNKFFKKYPPT